MSTKGQSKKTNQRKSHHLSSTSKLHVPSKDSTSSTGDHLSPTSKEHVPSKDSTSSTGTHHLPTEMLVDKGNNDKPTINVEGKGEGPSVKTSNLIKQPVPECPVDREPLDREKDIFPDKATERNILSCHVRCPNVGCEWTGETRDVEIHLQSCGWKIIQCSNPHCLITIERRLLDDHQRNNCQWRTVHCSYCDEEHAKCEEEKHALECRRRPVECFNGCGEVIAREEMTAHQDVVCSHTVVNCQYDYLGCDIKIKRSDVNDHLEQNLPRHFELSVEKLGEMQDETKILRRELEQMRVDYRTMNSRITGLENDVTKMKMKHKEMDTFSPYVWKVSAFWERVSKAKSGNDVRVESDTFYVGPQGYKMKLAMYPNGTKEARNAHISLYIALMKGKYDAILPWPFLYKVTLTIMDQNPDLMQRNNFVKSFIPEPSWKSMQRPDSEENERRGFGRFFSHAKLVTGSYVVDDTLFIRLEVGPVDKPAS